MGFWRTVVLITLGLSFVQPECSICSKRCEPLQTKRVNLTGAVSINCDQTSTDLKTFILDQDFRFVKSFSLRTPFLFQLNLTTLSKVPSLNLSSNNIKVFNATIFQETRILNLSNNCLTQLVSNFSQLTNLDLSYNKIKNAAKLKLNAQKLIYLNLSSNLIEGPVNLTITSLKHLDLSKNKIQQVKISSFKNLRTLNLSNNLITTLKNNTFELVPNLEVLDLSGNLLTELLDFSFNLSNLLKIDLKRNKIKDLSQKCFYGLNKLQFLDISSNNLKLISPRTIQYLSGLLQLIIADNTELASQDFGLLLATRRLKSVDASQTSQTKIPSSLTRSVRYLTLQSNNILQIQCGDLDSYPLLNTLDVSHNSISSIEDDALGRLELLTTLLLTNNSLITIPHMLPTNLKNLILDYNNIKQIAGNEFVGMPQLRTLDLSFNKIVNITDNSFASLLMLEKLNLSGNGVKLLSTSTFLGLRKLKTLDLSHMENVTKCEQALCFPIPESNQIQELNLQRSPTLSSRLLNDIAALKTLKELNSLNLAYSNLSDIRKDLQSFVPRITILNIEGNELNCSSIEWIHQWLQNLRVDNCIFEEVPESTLPTIQTTQRVTEATIETTTVTKVTTVQQQNQTDKTMVLTTENPDDSIYNISDEIFNSNEIWMKDSSPGVVYALSSDIPSSHPGLFILLLLPIALVSTCLLINYSRSKRNYTREIQYEADMEIPNISNELW